MTDRQQLVFLKAHVASLEAAIELMGDQLQSARSAEVRLRDENKRLAGMIAALEFELLKAHNKLAFAEEKNYVDGWVRMEETT